jgi:hypothetical protein
MQKHDQKYHEKEFHKVKVKMFLTIFPLHHQIQQFLSTYQPRMWWLKLYYM